MLNYKQLHYFWQVARAGSIARASEQLDLTPQTLSGQIGLLETALGAALFRRVGRGLELTETGRRALSYADEIFEIGTEMEQALRDNVPGRASQLRVGIADVMPKSIVYRLLAPALELAEPIKIVCREDKLERLLGELAIHRLDMVLADRPMPAELNIKGYSHKLGECGVSFFAAPKLAGQYGKDFPGSLNHAPLLVPSMDTAMRGRLMRWLDAQRLRPRVVGEFDDSALMKTFGQAGVGIFVAPSAIAAEIVQQLGVVEIGQVAEVLDYFYAITVERRFTHPAVVAISEAARQELFAYSAPPAE
jgi:LysR family transcriptional activator of nhaA